MSAGVIGMGHVQGLTHRGLVKYVNILQIMGGCFLNAKEGNYKHGEGQTRNKTSTIKIGINVNPWFSV